MKYVITIDLENDAFYNDDNTLNTAGIEVSRILTLLNNKIEIAGYRLEDFPLRDHNGNSVGFARITNDA